MNARTDEQFCHDKNFLVAQMTKFYYPWCSAVLAQERAPLSVLVFSPVFCDASVVVVVFFFPHSFYRSVWSDRLFFRATVRKYRALSSKSWKIDLVHFLYIDSFYVDKKADVNFFRQKPSICEENLRSESHNGFKFFNLKFANINFPRVRKQSHTEKFGH